MQIRKSIWPMTNAKHEATRTDAVVDTGAALASAGAFGLFGAVIGRELGSLGSSNHYNLSGKIGAWLGGVTMAVLSLYASFRSREQHERIISGLREENMRLRAELNGEPLPAAQMLPQNIGPKNIIESAEHQELVAEKPREIAL